MKLNMKTKATFFIALLILGILLIGSTVFGQVPQYGDSSLVNMDFERDGKEFQLVIHPDSTLLEVTYLHDQQDEIHLTEFNGDLRLDLTVIQDLFLNTTEGMTFISFIRKGKIGYLVLNGKIVGKTIGKKFTQDIGDVPVDKFRNTIAVN